MEYSFLFDRYAMPRFKYSIQQKVKLLRQEVVMEKTKDEEILSNYQKLIPFLAEFLGPGCEIVLHDTHTPDCSIIEIRNGYHTKRKVGDPLTDLAREMMESGVYKTHDYLSNYSGSGKGKQFISSTYFIKNEGRLIGMLCLNKDVGVVSELENVIQRMIKQNNLEVKPSKYSEILDASVNTLLKQSVSDAIIQSGLDPVRMTTHEKIEVIRSMKQKGIFKMKGAVAESARQLDVSEPTIYRYLHNCHD